MLFAPVRVAPLEIARCNELKHQAKATRYIPPHNRPAEEKPVKSLYNRVAAVFHRKPQKTTDEKVDKIIDKAFFNMCSKLGKHPGKVLIKYISSGDVELSNLIISSSSGEPKKGERKDLAALKGTLVTMKYYLNARVHNQVVQAYILKQIQEQSLNAKQVKELEKELDTLLRSRFSIKSDANEGAFLSYLSEVDSLSREVQIDMLKRLAPPSANYGTMRANDIRSKLNRALGELLYDRVAVALGFPTLSSHMEAVEDAVLSIEADKGFSFTANSIADKVDSDKLKAAYIPPNPEVEANNVESSPEGQESSISVKSESTIEAVPVRPESNIDKKIVIPRHDMKAGPVNPDITRARMGVKQLIALWESR